MVLLGWNVYVFFTLWKFFPKMSLFHAFHRKIFSVHFVSKNIVPCSIVPLKVLMHNKQPWNKNGKVRIVSLSSITDLLAYCPHKRFGLLNFRVFLCNKTHWMRTHQAGPPMAPCGFGGMWGTDANIWCSCCLLCHEYWRILSIEGFYLWPRSLVFCHYP